MPRKATEATALLGANTDSAATIPTAEADARASVRSTVLTLLWEKDVRIKLQEPLTTLVELGFPLVFSCLLLIDPETSAPFAAIGAAISFSVPCGLVLRTLNLEKELRLKEHLLVNGVRLRDYYVAVLALGGAIFTLIALIVSLVLGLGIFPHASLPVFLVTMLCFGAASLSFTLALSSIFWSARVATILGPLIFILSDVVAFPLKHNTVRAGRAPTHRSCRPSEATLHTTVPPTCTALLPPIHACGHFI